MSVDGDYTIGLCEYVATLEAELSGESYQWLHPAAAASVAIYLNEMRSAALRHDSGEVSRLTALVRHVFERDCCCGGCGHG